MKELVCSSIGEAWIKSCRFVVKHGKSVRDDNEKLKELVNFSLVIKNPKLSDARIDKLGDKSMIDWMMSNFFEQKRVPELKNSSSYGIRLFNYNGKDQVRWVTDKLKTKPETKGATIPLIMPTEDEAYIPCVSALDFKIRDNKLMLVAFCRSIDFGSKVYANMMALAKLQKMIADELKIKTGDLVMYVVSAHIYNKDYDKIKELIKNG